MGSVAFCGQTPLAERGGPSLPGSVLLAWLREGMARRWEAAVPRAAAIAFKPSLFYALAGFVIPFHILGLRAVGLGLRCVLGLRKYRSCNGDGEGQRHSG